LIITTRSSAVAMVPVQTGCRWTTGLPGSPWTSGATVPGGNVLNISLLSPVPLLLSADRLCVRACAIFLLTPAGKRKGSRAGLVVISLFSSVFFSSSGNGGTTRGTRLSYADCQDSGVD